MFLYFFHILISINIFKIQKFFKSNLGQRLLKAYKENKQVFRELPFITEIPVKRIEKDLIDKIFNNGNFFFKMSIMNYEKRLFLLTSKKVIVYN